MFRFLRTMSHKALKVETNIKKTRKVWPFHEKGVSLLRFNNIHSFYFQKRMSKSQDLLSYIREGRTMTQREKLRLIVQLSIPSILAQISATVMFFIDASMVGHLGAKASASIGIVESTGWLMGGLASAANMGFSVQVAHFIGANDFQSARRVLRQGLVCCFIFSLIISAICLGISPFLPYWLGGNAEIAHDASLYFAIIGLCGIFFQMARFISPSSVSAAFSFRWRDSPDQC